LANCSFFTSYVSRSGRPEAALRDVPEYLSARALLADHGLERGRVERAATAEPRARDRELHGHAVASLIFAIRSSSGWNRLDAPGLDRRLVHDAL